MKNIVIIDDCRTSLTFLQYMLCNEGCLVFPFLDVNMLMDHIERIQVDIIITDFLMFDVDGFSLLEKLKPILPFNTKLVITSSYNHDSMVSQCEELGIKFLPKPYIQDDIKKIIKED